MELIGGCHKIKRRAFIEGFDSFTDKTLVSILNPRHHHYQWEREMEMKNKLMQLTVGFISERFRLRLIAIIFWWIFIWREDKKLIAVLHVIMLNCVSIDSRKVRKSRLLRECFVGMNLHSFSNHIHPHLLDRPLDDVHGQRLFVWCESQNPPLWFIVSGYLLSLVSWETCGCWR